MSLVIEALLSFLAKLVGPVLAWLGGKEHAEKKEALKDAEDSRKDAQKWADAPQSDADFDRMLSDRIKRKRKAQDEPGA